MARKRFFTASLSPVDRDLVGGSRSPHPHALGQAYYRVPEIAFMLDIPLKRVRNWVDRGTLPCIRAGGRNDRLVAHVDLCEFLNIPGDSRFVVTPRPLHPDHRRPRRRKYASDALREDRLPWMID